MNLLFLGMTLSVVGKVMIAIAVIRAHTELANEHRVDAKVIRTFRTERNITIMGIMLIIIGYALEVIFLGGFTHLFTCGADTCAANLLSY